MKLDRIDRNFAVSTRIGRDGKVFFDVNQPPFSLHGIFFDGKKFRRMPESVAKAVSPGVYALHTNTAGGRVRFATDSAHIHLCAELANPGRMSHFPLTGSCGFDLHTGKRYVGTFVPPFDVKKTFEATVHIPEDLCDGTMRTYTLHFPLYSDVRNVMIGTDKNANLCVPDAYTYTKPVVFYGSSITQGGCASRPGNAYENIVSAALDCDHINLGFSGNAKAEDTMIDYIAGLDMSVFVCDYDHNAPSAEHLRNTHEKLFKAVRAKQPDLPVIFMTRPQYYLSADEKERLAVVQKTYENALADGDSNVYFLPGPALLDECVRDSALVDNCHPNDSGFVSMANAVIGVLGPILQKR